METPKIFDKTLIQTCRIVHNAEPTVTPRAVSSYYQSRSDPFTMVLRDIEYFDKVGAWNMYWDYLKS